MVSSIHCLFSGGSSWKYRLAVIFFTIGNLYFVNEKSPQTYTESHQYMYLLWCCVWHVYRLLKHFLPYSTFSTCTCKPYRQWDMFWLHVLKQPSVPVYYVLRTPTFSSFSRWKSLLLRNLWYEWKMNYFLMFSSFVSDILCRTSKKWKVRYN